MGQRSSSTATSVDDLKSSRSIQGITPFPDYKIIGRKNCFIPEQDHPEFHVQQEEG